MIKQLIALSALSLLGACSTYSNTTIGNNECNTKERVEQNKDEIAEYRDLRAKGLMKSAYIEMIGINMCQDAVCTQYHPARYDFVERKFDDSTRKGIYTIKATKDLTDKNCIGEPQTIEGVKYCYSVTKNTNDEIKSRYKFSMINQETYQVMKIDDLKTKTQVVKFSSCNIPVGQNEKILNFMGD